jgi:hypothetical protein
MKNHVIIISRKFPVSHRKSNKATFFLARILSGRKIHTIRQNYPFWEKRIKEVQEGKAVLSVREWTGIPYKSKQRELFKFTKENEVGIEKLVFRHTLLKPIVEGKPVSIKALARHDGLSTVDFVNWFASYDQKEDLAIIHFTNYRYAKDHRSAFEPI